MERHNKLASGAKISAQVSQIGSHIDISGKIVVALGIRHWERKRTRRQRKT